MKRGPSNYEVIEILNEDVGAVRSHGVFATLDEARGCVEYNKIGEYEIWQGDHIVEERTRDWRNVRAMESGEGSGDWDEDGEYEAQRRLIQINNAKGGYQ